uniref:AP-2 complex subunit alpha n=1 Tax=Chrysotila carterae TaxID=13221 RepID=A0A7S4F9F0_CHRCT
MEAVNLISSPRYSEKSVGYAWCALMLREGDDLLRLIINSIRVDLISKNENAVCLALNAICNVGGKEFAESLSSDVIKLLTSNVTKTYVRKKAALTTLRLYRKAPDVLPPSEWSDKVLMLLDEKNIGVLTSVSSLVLGVMAVDPSGWEAAAPKAARTLTRLVLNKDYSNDYLYYGIPTPWLQIKLLRMLQYFPPPEEHALKLRISEVLQRIISGTDVTKNVNKNNATHAVLFEAINLTIHLGSKAETLQQSINLLGRFISIREANIRYLGLETMARLSQLQPETLDGLKKHQSTILFSLKDPDISIRRRALDLVYSMCDTSTVHETVAELLTYLQAADTSIREELVLKVAILAERFATDNQWYVDVVLKLIKEAGDYVSEEIWYRVVQIITNQGDDLQKYATETAWKALSEEAMPHRTLVKVAGYVLGEFGHMIADTPGCGAAQQFALLHKQFTQSDNELRALLLNTYVKLSHSFAEIAPQVSEVMAQYSTALDQEVQQRANEYISLSAPPLSGVKSTVLEMMPHFTERESIVQKQLSGKKGADGSAPPRERKESKAEAEEAGEAVSAPAAPPPAAPDLLGMDDPSPPQAAGVSGAADLLGALDVSSPAPAAPADDLLGLMGGGPPAPPPAQSAGGGSLLGAPAAQSPQYMALCLRNDGVLFEDATLQIGIKMEFNGHQGRMAVYFGNKCPAPLMSFGTQLSPCAALAIQASPVAATLNPRSQQQLLLNIECLDAFGEGPQLAVRFMGGSTPQPLVVPLPIIATKFVAPLRVEGADFFRRWKTLDGKEQQQIFKLTAMPLAEALVERVVGAGLRMALLKGVDPNPANFVASGWLVTKGAPPQGDSSSVLMRLEVNAQAAMCRASVRASSPAIVATVMKLVLSQLGTPVS